VKPSAFDYERPGNLNDAIALVRREDIAVKLLAGGQSLGPMLNLRLAQPDLLVDVTGIPELKRVEESTDAIVLGACITHADIEDRRVPDVTRGALPEVAHDIAYRAVRNRGTIGGSLAHADPAADWMTCLAAIGAEVLIRGPSGQRRIVVGDFMRGAFEVGLEPGEIIEAVRVPRLSANARWGFHKISRKTGEMAQAMSAVLHDPEHRVCCAVIGATGSAPIVLSGEAQKAAGATAAELATIFDGDAAARSLDEAGIIDPVGRRLLLAALRRALEKAARA
jgi:carbon-monoxide dehydrogenase medium subunit